MLGHLFPLIWSTQIIWVNVVQRRRCSTCLRISAQHQSWSCRESEPHSSTELCCVDYVAAAAGIVCVLSSRQIREESLTRSCFEIYGIINRFQLIVWIFLWILNVDTCLWQKPPHCGAQCFDFLWTVSCFQSNKGVKMEPCKQFKHNGVN